MDNNNSNYRASGSSIDGQFQNLQIRGSHPPPPQQDLPHAQSDPPILNHEDIIYEAPPGPPPGWKPQAEHPPAISEPPSSTLPTTEQAPHSHNAKPVAPASARHHPSGVLPLTDCANHPIDVDMDWFYYPSIESFLICSYCYTQRIYDTQFQQLFQKMHLTAAGGYRCRFGSARMKEIWTTSVSSGDLDPVLKFMKNRAAIPDCQQAKELEGEEWYVNEDLQGMTLCRACVEDATIRPPFRQKFQLRTRRAANCDMSMRFVVCMFEKYKEAGSWEAFVNDVTPRLAVGSCPQTAPAPGVGQPWFQTRYTSGHPTLKICAACYLDFFGDTLDASDFEKATEVWDYIRCDIGSSYLKVAALSAASKGDTKIFWKALQAMRNQPQCIAEGIQGGNCYTLLQKPAGFSICGSCYVSVVEPLGQGHFFICSGNASERILCSLNPGHGRSSDYLKNFAKTSITGDIRYVENYATKYGNVLTCPRFRPSNGKGGKFWGWGKLTICEQCYIDFAKETSLESKFLLKGNVDAAGNMCDLYSPRMRNLYSEACQTGDLEKLLAIAGQRRDVWSATIPVIHQIESNLQMASFQANMHRQSSSFYNFLGNSVQNTMGSNYTVGNSYAGYGHANEFLLTGQTHQRQAQEAMLQVTDISRQSHVEMLKQQWAKVE